MMDKPAGPRQPPDKRHAAYESIFGRAHLQPELPPSGYPQYLPQQPTIQPYLYSQQPYPNNVDRRSSFSPSLASHGYNHNTYPAPPPHAPSGAYRQSYYPTQPPPPPQPYPQMQQQFPYPASLAPPNPPVSRARSIISNANSNIGVIPPNNESPDHSLGIPSHSGMTAAQAYQAQIYNHSPSGGKYRSSPGPPDRTSYSPSQNGGSQPVDTPRHGVSLEHDDSRLGINFGDGNGNNSGDEGSSELPWALNEHAPVRKNHHSSQHLRQPSVAESTHSNFSLHVDTIAAQAIRSSVTTASPSSSPSTAEASATLVDHDSRKSTESARPVPKFGTVRSRVGQDRSATGSVRATHDQRRSSKPPIPPSFREGRNSPASVRPSKKAPIVYPALLSRVAEAFRDRIPVTDRIKDGLTYKDTFDGREAVDKIAYIIKTTDRNLALLLGRALDAQKIFHDVTYDHRLRDSANELYQFQTILPSPFVGGELSSPPPDAAAIQKGLRHLSSQSDAFPEEDGSMSPESATLPTLARKDSLSSDEDPLPSGVFTLLTDCYSPTCSRDQLCYSIACPRRLEQQARLNMKPQPGLSKQISRESLGDVPDDGTLWIHSVPQEIVNSVSDAEKRRQEAINEVIYTERDFVRDMEYLRDVWRNRLKESDIINQATRQEFITTVFWNIEHIIAVNTRLRDALNKRQKSFAVVEKIGDIFLDAVPHFSPFVSYGGHQLAGKDRFEKEKSSNPAFAAFVETTERLPESRKLELNAYLTKPTTRLARYPLLLEAVLKHTPDDSPDKHTLPKVVKMVREFLTKVNTESGKAENRASLQKLHDALFFKQGEEVVDLRLLEDGREMIHKGALSKRDGELHVFLLDHSMLFTKLVKGKQQEQYKVYRRPIPLELLLISAADEATAPIRNQQRSTRERGGMPNVVAAVTIRHESKGQHWINFMYLGRKCYTLMLWADSALSQRKWLESIFKQQQAMRERSMIFDTVTLSEGFFSGPNKVNCAAPFEGGRSIVYGTDDGVYISSFTSPENEPIKVLALLDVVQVDVLEEYDLLIVLSERQVITFPLEALDKRDPMAGLRRAKRISSHTSFFKAGFCLGRVLVCIVKSSQLSSTFKTLEPIDQNIRGRAKPTFRKLLQGGNDTLKLFREFYIPVESTSIHYLKTKMCVGCSKGFEIVDLETLDTQGLLDPHDESLDFVRRRDNLRPMAIYRIHNEFLLCYDEFAFYVNKNGRRSRSNFMVQWEGQPTGFALHEPYVLAFEPSFVEIRHIETGLLSQVIQGFNLRLLFADTPPSVTNIATQQYIPHQAGYHTPYGNYGHLPHTPYISQPRHIQGVGRDEILIVSEDRVLALRTAAGPQRFMSDDGSMMSMPR